MHVTALKPNSHAEDIPLERLAGNASLTEHDKIAEAARQFEAVLLRQILAETQKPLLNSKFSDNSTAAGIYRDLIGNQLADSISKSGTVGLANTLERQLDRQLRPVSTAGHARLPEALPTAPSITDVVRPFDSAPPARRVETSVPAISPHFTHAHPHRS
jgi:flagellar protein FlgJ